MDVHSIKCDLVAMEMELKYHDADDEIVLADSKTPKVSHSTNRLSQHQSNKSVPVDKIPHDHERRTVSNYVSLDLMNKKELEIKVKQNSFLINQLSQRDRSTIHFEDASILSLMKLNANEVKNKMISFSALNNFNSCNAMFAISESEDDYFFIMNNDVKVIIKSSVSKGTFTFQQPGHVIVAREEEMKQVANMLNSEWKGSLVMQKLLKHKVTSRHNASCSISPKRQVVSIQLETVEHEFDTVNWSSALKRSIEDFYKSGILSIHSDSSGRDIVLALKFLKLIYAPNQLAFESFGTHLKFKLWSDYVLYRKDIAMWVKKCLVQNYSQHKYMFVTHPVLLTNATFYCHGQRCEQLHGGLQRFFNNDPNSSYTAVHDLFAGDYNEPNFQEIDVHKSSTGSLHSLRDDFNAFLKHELPGTEIEFSLQTVTINTITSSSSFNDHTLVRPVLCVELEEKQSGPKQPRLQLHRLPTKSVSVLKRLDISSLTNSSSSETENDEFYHQKPRNYKKSIDALTAEWLLGVFSCRSPTGASIYD